MDWDQVDNGQREACQPAKLFMMVGTLRAPEPAGPWKFGQGTQHRSWLGIESVSKATRNSRVISEIIFDLGNINCIFQDLNRLKTLKKCSASASIVFLLYCW